MEQLELCLVTTSNFGFSIVFHTLQRQFNFYIAFASLKSAARLRTSVKYINFIGVS